MLRMTELLKQAFGDAQRLPEHQQDRLAHFIKRLVSDPDAVNGDAYWEMLLADPRSDEVLERLAREAEDDIRRGDVVDLDALCERCGAG
jgi:hypothetical protein